MKIIKNKNIYFYFNCEDLRKLSNDILIQMPMPFRAKRKLKIKLDFQLLNFDFIKIFLLMKMLLIINYNGYTKI